LKTTDSVQDEALAPNLQAVRENHGGALTA